MTPANLLWRRFSLKPVTLTHVKLMTLHPIVFFRSTQPQDVQVCHFGLVDMVATSSQQVVVVPQEGDVVVEADHQVLARGRLPAVMVLVLVLVELVQVLVRGHSPAVLSLLNLLRLVDLVELADQAPGTELVD